MIISLNIARPRQALDMEGIRQTYHADGLIASVPYRALIPKGASRRLCGCAVRTTKSFR